MSKRLDDSNIDNKSREIQLILQIVKTVTIDKFTTIQDIKKQTRQHFNKYMDEFSLLIKDYDISSLDNMNALRTLEYYKSNIISINPKNLRKYLNESNVPIKGGFNSDLDNSQTLYDTKEKINNQSNVQKIFPISDDHLKINQFSNQDDLINKSYNDQKNFNNEVDLPDNFNNSNIGYNKYNNPVFSPIRINSNLNTFHSNMNEYEQKSNVRRNNYNKSQIYSSSDSLFSQENQRKEINDARSKYSVSPTPISENLKHYGLNNQTHLNTYKERSFTNDHMLSTQEKDYQIVKEEIENLSITNKILNKSNLELKNHIKSIEESREKDKDFRNKLNESIKIIEGLKDKITSLQKTNQELNEKLESLKRNSNEILNENKKSVGEIDQLNKNFEVLDKNNFDLKNQIDSLEDVNKRQETEKHNLQSQLNEKEKTISELQEKIRCMNDLNETTKKSCRDYEDMLKGMKRTIDIMKKSNDDSDNEIMRLKLSKDEVREELLRKTEEYECLDKVKSSLQNEIEMFKNEVLFLYNDNNSKDKSMNDNSSSMRNLTIENDRLKMKLENSNKIIEEKNKAIENIKISVLSLNRNLEEAKSEIDQLKRKLNEEMIERNKITRNTDLHEYHYTESKKQIEELIRLKDNLYKQNFALEEDNVENRNKFYQIRNENENLNIKINFLNENIIEFQKDLLNVNNLKNLVEQEKENLSMRIAELNNVINQGKSAEISLKNDIENLNSKILSKERTIDNLLKSKDEINSEIFILKEKINVLINEKNKILEDFDQKNNEIHLNETRTRKEMEKYSNELRSKENLIENLHKTISDFNAKMNDISTKREKDRVILEKTIEDLKKKLMESTEKEKTLKIEKDDCNNDLKYKIKFIESLENRINELNENLLTAKKLNEKNNNILLVNMEKIEEFKQINEELQNKLDKSNQKNDDLSINLEELKHNHQEIMNKNSTLQKDLIYYKNMNEKLENKLSSLDLNSNNNVSSNKNNNKVDFNSSFNASLNNPNNNIYKRTEKPKMNENAKEDNNISNSLKSSHNKSFNDQIKLSLNDQYFKPDENMLPTSELNSKFEKKKRDKVDLVDGVKVIFSILDKKRIIRFDIENRLFKVIEFADFGNFEQTYNSKGCITINILDGLLILTGENSDQFYYYSHLKHSMTKLANLNSNHENGCLVYDERGNSIICLSGKNSRSVEKYVNDDIISPILKKNKSVKKLNETQNKNSWIKLPDLNNERILGSFIFIDKFIYGFFGFSPQTNRYLDVVERLNLDYAISWDVVNFKKNDNISCFKKCFATAKVSDDEILFIGGSDGFNENPIDNFSFFNIVKNEFYFTESKFSQNEQNYFYDFHRNSNSVISSDINNNTFYISFDERDNIHIIDSKNMQHIVFNSFE